MNIKINSIDSVHKPNGYLLADGSELNEHLSALLGNFTGQEAFNIGNVIKYVIRHDKKNGVEDLEKAKEYIDIQIAIEKQQLIKRSSDIKGGAIL